MGYKIVINIIWWLSYSLLCGVMWANGVPAEHGIPLIVIFAIVTSVVAKIDDKK